MEDIDLAKALSPYKIVERTNLYWSLKYSKSLHTGIYIFTVIWIGIFIGIKNSTVPVSSILVILLLIPYLAFCSLFRYSAIKNPITIYAEKGQLKLKFKKFFKGEREVTYNFQDLQGVQPFEMYGKQTFIASIRVCLTHGAYEQFFFASSEKPLAVERSKNIASMVSQVLGIQLLK